MRTSYTFLLIGILCQLALASGKSESGAPKDPCLDAATQLELTVKGPAALHPDSSKQRELPSLGDSKGVTDSTKKQLVTHDDLEEAGFKILKYEFKKGGTSYLHLVEKDGKKYLIKDFKNDPFYNNMAPWEGEMLAKLFEKTPAAKTKSFVFGKNVKIAGRDVIQYDFKEDAESLWDVDTKTFSHEKKLDIAKQLLEASQILHDAGIIHRDIKPGNILLDKDGKIYLIDLGLAAPKGEEPKLSIQMGQPARTPGGGTRVYMSPDQAGEAPAKIAHDIHSLNKVLVEIFTGTSLVDQKHYLLMHSAFGFRDLGYDSQGRPDELPVIKTAPEDKGLTPQLATAVYSGLARTPKEKWEMVEKAEKLKSKDFYDYYFKIITREIDAQNPSPTKKPSWPFASLFTKKESKPWLAVGVAEDFLNNRGLIERLHDMNLSEEQRDSIILGYLFLKKNKKRPLIPGVSDSVPSAFLHFDQFQSKLRYLQEKGLAKPDSYYEERLKDLIPSP